MRRRVLIIGGGVSGLFLGSLIGDGVRIIEEHSVIGFPEHCTGIISTSTLYRMRLPRRLVEDSYRKFILYFPGGYRIVISGSPLAVKVDRPGVEKELYYRALDEGAEIVLGERVEDIASDGRISLNGGLVKGELVVLAEGYKQYFSRKLGLVRKSRRIPAIQARIRGQVNIRDVEVYFSSLTPKYFSWLVPIGDREAVIGLAAEEKGLLTRLQLLLKVLEKTGRISSYKITKIYGGLVLRGPLGELTRDRVVAIGDSIGMVKPLTGGGLYPISIAGLILSKLIKSYLNGSMSLLELREEYSSRVEKILKNLRVTYNLLNIIDFRVEDYLRVIAKGLNRIGLETVIDEVEYDDHLRNLLIALKPKNIVRLTGSMITGFI